MHLSVNFQTKLFQLVLIFCGVACYAGMGFGQSKLSQQLQQKLKDRKAASERDTDSDAPTTQPQTQLATFSAKTPQEFADAIQLSVAARNLAGFNNLVSWTSIATRATSQLSGKPIDEFKTRLLNDVKGKNSLGAKIINTVNSGGSYDFLKLKKSDKTVVAVFRMLLPAGRGVNYHEYALAKTTSGQVVASDIYVYLTGEPLSASIRRNLITALGNTAEGKSLKLTGKDKLLADNLKTVEALTQALAKQDAKLAREQILKLPNELRNDKAIQTLTLNTYKKSSAFETVLASVRKIYPKDVFMDMIAIDVMVRQKKYQEAIDAIERINKRTGGDPHLKILHGRMLLNLNKQAPGRQMIKEALTEDDSLLSGYWNLVSFSLKDKDHVETLNLLKSIHTKFKINFKDLRQIPSYQHFVKSAEFEDWKEYLKAESASAPVSDPSQKNNSRR